MKCYKNHFGMIVSAVLAVLMGLFMGISILLIEHRPINWVSLLDIWGDITLVVTLVLILMPLNEWGNKFAEKCRCRPGTVVFTLVANIIPTFIINTVLAAVIPALGIFYNEAIPRESRMAEWLGVFFGGWLLTFVISYFLSILAAKIGEAVALRTLGVPGESEASE